MNVSSPSGGLGRCGRFTLVSRIGVGGMGEIFLAVDPEGRRFAVKRLLPACAADPVFIGMFLDEARLAERLRHPNVSAVYEHGQHGEHYFLVMELIEGLSLKELLERREHRGLPYPLACRIIAEVAAGLDYAHRQVDDLGVPLGVVHRDVSPANIMIDLNGRVKLVDFGLAKARTQLMKTQPGLVKGKFGYLAPEQLGGRIDWRTDVFALGLCLYESLTGLPLFAERTAAETVLAIRDFREVPSLEIDAPAAPRGLDPVLRRALAPNPNDRFESAAAFRVAIARAIREAGHNAVTARMLAEEVRERRGTTTSVSTAAPRVTAPEITGVTRVPSERPPIRRSGPPAWVVFSALAATLAVLLALTAWLATM